MKRSIAALSTAVVTAGFFALTPAASPNAATGEYGVERAVSFEIENRNTSKTAETATSCAGASGDYTLRGSLVGPPGVEGGNFDAVTLYVHGSGDASTWHFTAVPGVDHISEMARLGHVSVFVHQLGFGPSDPVDGKAVCIGHSADHVEQIIAQLRAGTYTMEGAPPPSFERVALAGHSAGGLITQLAQVSFNAADALVVAGWTDYALGAGVTAGQPGVFPYDAVAGKSERCVTKPESKWGPGGPSGWAYLFTSSAEFEALAHDVDPQVKDAFIELYEQDPCAWHYDSVEAITANIALTPSVDVPVLLANGDRDPIAPPAAIELQRARYATGGADVSSLIVPGTAHQIMLGPAAPVFRAGLSHWLKKHGF